MTKYPDSGRKILALLCAGIVLAAGTIGTVARADSGEPAMDKAFIEQQVRKELKRLIEQEGFLDAAIEKGINTYIQKQRAAAAAEKNRVRSQQARNMRPVSPQRDHILGNPDAPISLVEYSDFECPFCKRFHPTAKQLVEKNAGRINLVYRHFPLGFHNPGAEKEAEATECVAQLGGNEKFWGYADLIYQRTHSNGKGFPVENLRPLAEEIGLDGKAFDDCLNSGKMASRVGEDVQDGVKAGITGTPGLIFLDHATGDVFATAGAMPIARLQAAVDRLQSARKSTKE